MTIYVVEFLERGTRREMRCFRTTKRMHEARTAWYQKGQEYETRTTACYILDAEMKEASA